MIHRVNVCCLGLALSWAMLAQVSGTYYNTYYYIKSLEYKVNSLSQKVDGALDRLEDVEAVLTNLARQECQTGDATIKICPEFGTTPIEDILMCVMSPEINGNSVNATFNIPFEPNFLNPPIVDASISSLALYFGKNCTLDIVSVSNEGFTVNYQADDLLPLETAFTWYACPSALFGPDESLPRGG